MRKGMAAAFVAAFGVALAGCGDSAVPLGPSGPAAVSVPAPPPNGPVNAMWDVTLSGVVFEVTQDGRSPVEHAAVYCEPCGAETHTWAYSDADGFYLFRGVWTYGSTLPIRINVAKDGFGDPKGLPRTTPPNPFGPGWREVSVTGDTRFDMELVRK
jgi:hypothetical protein